MSKLHSNRVEMGTMTTSQRDALSSPPAGTIIFNSTDGTPQIYDGSSWKALTNPFSASGGTETTVGSKKVHTFTSYGNQTSDLFVIQNLNCTQSTVTVLNTPGYLY